MAGGFPGAGPGRRSNRERRRPAAAAVEMAARTLRDLRIAEVVELDMQLENGQIRAYRAKVRLSFKVEEKVA